MISLTRSGFTDRQPFPCSARVASNTRSDAHAQQPRPPHPRPGHYGITGLRSRWKLKSWYRGLCPGGCSGTTNGKEGLRGIEWVIFEVKAREKRGLRRDSAFRGMGYLA